jgi:homoserine O-acetyltransferase/O-succinyltransferase
MGVEIDEAAIVSFPNIAYRESRDTLAGEGRAPQALGSEEVVWYNTPNLRSLSIADFETFCSDHAIRIHRRIALDTQSSRPIDDDPNLNADLAIFVLSR